MDEPLISKSGRRWPRFSLSAIFYLVFCLAVSLTAAATPAWSEDEFASLPGVSIHAPLVAWHYALLSLAALGTATALTQQGNALAGVQGFGLTRWAHYAHAAALSGLLIALALMQRGVLVWPEREEVLFLYVNIFPDSLLLVLLIRGAGLMFQDTEAVEQTSRRLIGWFAILAGCTLALFHVAEQHSVSYLVHIATEGIEANEPLSLQRPDAYPYHRGEGFFTHRATMSAVGGLVITIGACVTALTTERTHVKRVAVTVSLAGAVATSGYNLWFWRHEYPRVSPDLASAGWATNTADLVVGAALIAVVGYWLARLCTQRRSITISTITTNSRLGSWPKFLAATGLLSMGVVDIVKTAFELADISGFVSSVLGPMTTWEVVSQVASFLFETPWGLLTIASILQGVLCCFRLWRGGRAIAVAHPFKQVAMAWIVFLLLGLLTIPTLAAWGFASWLGPWWL